MGVGHGDVGPRELVVLGPAVRFFLDSVKRRRRQGAAYFAGRERTPFRAPAAAVNYVRLLPMLLKMFSIWPRRKTIARMTAIAMTAMMSAYSTRPWPSSSRTNF